MFQFKIWTLIALTLVLFGIESKTMADRPNVLWILTDDHRYDSIRAFNKMLHGREMSELGYVESPHTDRLAKMGTTFINAYCQAHGCAPSRASMHYGRYPFRSGIYEFGERVSRTTGASSMPLRSLAPTLNADH